MITDVLLEYRALLPWAALTAAIVCVGLGYLLLGVRRHGPRLLWALASLSLLVVVALTLVPSGDIRVDGTGCTVQFAYPTFGRVELFANVALFFPLAYFSTLATRHPVLTLAAGSVLSIVIETAQALVPALGRACDTNDWLMNTIGVVAGVLLALGTIAISRRVDGRHAGTDRHTRGTQASA